MEKPKIKILQGEVIRCQSGTPTIGTIELNGGGIAKFSYPGLLPLEPKDLMVAVSIIEEATETLEIIRLPRIIFPSSPHYLRSFIKDSTGCKEETADRLYDELVEGCPIRYSVVEYIDRLSEDQRTLKRSRGPKSKLMIPFLKDWYFRRIKRRVEVFGLTERIDDYGRLRQRVDDLMDNAFWVPDISVELAERIYQTYRPPRTDEERNKMAEYKHAGELLRMMHAYTTDQQYMAIPKANLADCLSDQKDVVSLKLLIKEGALVSVPGNAVMLRHAHRVNTRLAAIIRRLYLAQPIRTAKEVELKEADDLNELQQQGIYNALMFLLSAITGGAGTGKTKMIKTITKSLPLHTAVLLTSSSSKAVRCIRESTDRKDPQNMHRFLRSGLGIPKGTKHVVIINDEATMTNSEVLLDLLELVGSRYPFSLVGVGDPVQLQPVGPGHFFAQILTLPDLVRVDLIEVYRFGSDLNSGIIINTNAIRELAIRKGMLGKKLQLIYEQKETRVSRAEGRDGGKGEGKGEAKGDTKAPARVRAGPSWKPPPQEPGFRFQATSNFKLVENAKVQDILDMIVRSGRDLKDVRIITPYNADVKMHNVICQSAYHGKKTTGDVLVGDLIIYTKNDPDLGLANGDEGVVVEVTGSSYIIDFGQEELVEVPISQFTDLAYSLTGHGSQGSQYPLVIVYIPRNRVNRSFLDISLAYVMTSRAMKMMWIVGEIADLESAVGRMPRVRHDRLAEMILAAPEEAKARGKGEEKKGEEKKGEAKGEEKGKGEENARKERGKEAKPHNVLVL